MSFAEFTEGIKQASEKNQAAIKAKLVERTGLVNQSWLDALEAAGIEPLEVDDVVRRASLIQAEAILASEQKADAKKQKITQLLTGQLSINQTLDYLKAAVPNEVKNVPLRELLALLVEK